MCHVVPQTRQHNLTEVPRLVGASSRVYLFTYKLAHYEVDLPGLVRVAASWDPEQQALSEKMNLLKR